MKTLPCGTWNNSLKTGWHPATDRIGRAGSLESRRDLDGVDIGAEKITDNYINTCILLAGLSFKKL
jgi:hypothetical protein